MERRNLKKSARPRYFLVAGPQASGKSTAISFIGEKFPRVKIYKEIAPEIMKKYECSASVFVTKKIEEEILKKSLERVENISVSRVPGVHVDETGIFGIAHAKSLGYPDLAEKYYEKFISAMSRLDVFVLFIDTSPEISFARRKKYYKGRGLKKSELEKCRRKIFSIYKYLIGFYKNLNFKKSSVANDGIVSIDEFLNCVLDACMHCYKI